MKIRKIICAVLSAVLLVSGALYALPDLTGSASVVLAAENTISFEKTSLSIGLRESIRLNIKTNSSEKIEWTSSDNNTVIVNNGKITGTAKGTAIITAKLESGKMAKCFITVKPSPSKVTITKSEITLGVGESYSVGSGINDGAACKTRTYSSADSSIVQMNTTNWVGKFTAKKPGTTYVTVRTYNGKTASCKVTVKNAPTKITLTKGLLTMGIGETYTLGSGLNSGEASADRTYRSSNNNIVKMTNTKWTGIFTAQKVGTAYVTVRTYNGKEASCKVVVKSAPQKVALTRGIITLTPGMESNVSAIIAAGTASEHISYRVSSNIIKILKTENNKCVFKAVKKGTAYITVRTYNGKEASCKVEVKSSPEKVTLNKTKRTLSVGGSAVISANVPADSYCSEYKFSCSNNAVVKITPSGSKCVVKALKKGSATVTVRTFNGKTASCTVTVK